MGGPVDRVANAAQDVKPLRIALSVLAAPFYALGLVVGLVVVVGAWVVAAVQVGFTDARGLGSSTDDEAR